MQAAAEKRRVAAEKRKATVAEGNSAKDSAVGGQPEPDEE